MTVGKGQRKSSGKARKAEPAKEDAGATREMELLRAELQTTQKEFESFCYSVSHDLRAPLRCVDGFSSALLHEFGQKLEPPAREYLQRIIDSSRKMASLIDELLVLSRIQRAEIALEELPLSEMVQKRLERLRTENPERKVTVNVAPGVRARGDRMLIGTLLDRLLENAWKFTAKTEQARIEFENRTTPEERAYVIRDNGAGFNPAYEGKLFKLFQRLHSHADFPGIGGGLAVARAIVLRHHGRTWAEGALGRGAAFFFTLGTDQL